MSKRNPYSISVVTPPSSEPITLTEMWLHLRVDDPAVQEAETDLVNGFITAAREHVEMYTRRTFMPTIFDMFLDNFPNPFDTVNPFVFFKESPFQILLPRTPFLSLQWIKYYDLSNTLQTLVINTDFCIDQFSEPSRITTAFQKIWPYTFRRLNSVNIRFTAGYGEDSEAVPAVAKVAIKLLVGDMYENREQGLVGAPKIDNKTFERLLNGITLWEF